VAGFALVSKFFLYDCWRRNWRGGGQPPRFRAVLHRAGAADDADGRLLPLLARAVATDLGSVAERIGHLYGLNTLGAGAGALLGGWLLVGNLGYKRRAGAGRGARRAGGGAGADPAARTVPHQAGARRGACGRPAGEPFGSCGCGVLLVFLSGYVIVAMEIVWVRLLGQIGSTMPTCSPPCSGCSCWRMAPASLRSRCCAASATRARPSS
jgi:hypothetical protein